MSEIIEMTWSLNRTKSIDPNLGSVMSRKEKMLSQDEDSDEEKKG